MLNRNMTPGYESDRDLPDRLLLRQPANGSRHKHIVVPTSLSHADRTALQLGLEMADLHQAKLTVLHVLTPDEHQHSLHWLDAIYRLHQSMNRPAGATAATDLAEVAELARRRIQSFLEREFPESRNRDFPISAECRMGEVAESIARFANDTGADLVIMSSHQSRWWSPLRASCARRVLQLTKQQVILVRPDGGEFAKAKSASA